MDKAVDSIPTAMETDTPTQSNHPRKKNRRGAGSRAKAAEKYRTHKNDTVGTKFVTDRISKFLLENAYTPEDLFGPMVQSIPVVQPIQPISITTHKLKDIATKTVETLVSACKVPTTDVNYDIETVQLASSLQAFAKISVAQQGTPLRRVSADEDTLVDQVIRNASQSILPIAVYIDQLGKVECDDQLFVPVEEPLYDDVYSSFTYENLRTKKSPYGPVQQTDLLTNTLIPDDSDLLPCDIQGLHGGDMYFLVYDRPTAIDGGYIIQDTLSEAVKLGEIFVPPVIGRYVEVKFTRQLPPPHEIFARYVEFLSRVQKKLPMEKLPSLRFDKAYGTMAQLVFSGAWNGMSRDVYCARKVDGNTLFIGGAFELNVKPQPLTQESVCAVRASVCTQNAISRLMQTLSQRVERK